MNKFILTTFIIVSSLLAQGQQSSKWNNDLEEAAKLSLKTGKPILANFTGSDWCGWCIRLKKEVFDKSEFKTWADQNVILLEVDFPRRKKLDEKISTQNRNLQQNFAQLVRGYPTVLLFDVAASDGKLALNPIAKSGYVSGGPKPFMESLNQEN